MVVGTAKPKAAASPNRDTAQRREIIFSVTPQSPHGRPFLRRLFYSAHIHGRFDSDQVARARFKRDATDGLSERDVRYGSKADVEPSNLDVRFTPKSRHRLSLSSCPLCAKSRHATIRVSLVQRLGCAGRISRGFSAQMLAYQNTKPCKVTFSVGEGDVA
jgi:hypothetical protein